MSVVWPSARMVHNHVFRFINTKKYLYYFYTFIYIIFYAIKAHSESAQGNALFVGIRGRRYFFGGTPETRHGNALKTTLRWFKGVSSSPPSPLLTSRLFASSVRGQPWSVARPSLWRRRTAPTPAPLLPHLCRNHVPLKHTPIIAACRHRGLSICQKTGVRHVRRVALASAKR